METDRLVETKNNFGAVANHLRAPSHRSGSLNRYENLKRHPHLTDVRRVCVSDVIQSDDGRYRLGIHDDGPGFETRPFAASVMARERPPPDDPEMRRPGAASTGTNRKVTQREFTNYAPLASRLQGFSGDAARDQQQETALAAALRAAEAKRKLAAREPIGGAA